METNERMKKKVNKFKINKTVRKNKLAIKFYRRNNLLMTVWKKNCAFKEKTSKKICACLFILTKKSSFANNYVNAYKEF